MLLATVESGRARIALGGETGLASLEEGREWARPSAYDRQEGGKEELKQGRPAGQARLSGQTVTRLCSKHGQTVGRGVPGGERAASLGGGWRGVAGPDRASARASHGGRPTSRASRPPVE